MEKFFEYEQIVNDSWQCVDCGRNGRNFDECNHKEYCYNRARTLSEFDERIKELEANIKMLSERIKWSNAL